jgi:Glycine cleavage system T protein (aminomethyltransferase)
MIYPAAGRQYASAAQKQDKVLFISSYSLNYPTVSKQIAGIREGLPDDVYIYYEFMCNEHGGVVDDLIVHKLGENNYFIVVNAANKEKDFQWMLDHAEGRCVFSDISDYIGDIAIQGPLAFSVLSKIAEEKDIPEKYYTFTDEVYAAGIKCMKYNPKVNDEAASLQGFTNIHPLQPDHTVQGCIGLMIWLQS